MRLTLVVAFALVASYASAQSQSAANQPVGNKSSVNQQPTINVTLTPQQKSADELKAEAQKRQEDLAIQTAQLAFNERLLWVTALQALIAAISIGVSIQALRIARAQSAIALAAKRNMDTQTEHMRGQLIATQQSANAAVMAVEHADRPWIRVFLTPETLTTSDGEFLEIRARVTVKNIGKSVAEQVMIWNYLAVDPRTLRAEQEKLRAYFDRPELIKNIGGMTFFPDEEKTQIHSVGTGKEAPEKYWREMMPDMLDRDLGDRILPLTYIGCVGYRYGTSDKWHYTYWGYDLVSSDGRHLPLRIATGKLPQPPYLRESFMGNLNRAT